MKLGSSHKKPGRGRLLTRLYIPLRLEYLLLLSVLFRKFLVSRYSSKLEMTKATCISCLARIILVVRATQQFSAANSPATAPIESLRGHGTFTAHGRCSSLRGVLVLKTSSTTQRDVLAILTRTFRIHLPTIGTGQLRCYCCPVRQKFNRTILAQ